MPSWDTTTDAESLQKLQRCADALASRLEAYARELESQGAPAPASLLESLDEWRRDFETLAAKDPGRANGAPASLDDLRRSFAAAERRDRVERILDEVFRLGQVAGAPLPALDACHAAAGTLRQRLAINPDDPELQGDVQALLERRHPWCGLLRLVTEAESLDDGAWTSLHDAVGEALGPSLAAAAARARLELRPARGAPPLAENLQHLSQGESAAPDGNPLSERGRGRYAGPGHDSVFDEEAAVPAADADDDVLKDEAVYSPSTLPFTPPPLPGTSDSPRQRAGAVLPPPLPATPGSSAGWDSPPAVRAWPGPATSPHLPEALAVEPTGASVNDLVFRAPDDGNAGALGGQPALPTGDDIAALEAASAAVSGDAASIFEDPEPEACSAPPASARPAASSRSAAAPGLRESVRTEDSASRPGSSSESSGTFLAPKGPIFEAARLARHAGELARTSNLADLILELIYAGRSGLAHQLARCLEARPRRLKPATPSWLIRVWTLGNAVQYPHGRLAAQIADDLAGAAAADVDSPEAAPKGKDDAEWRRAYGLLVRAALLRPAVLAPKCGASAMLRGLPMLPDQMQVYNFCARACELADQRPWVSFRAPPAGPRGRVALDQRVAALQDEVRTWQEAQAERMAWAPAPQLFLHAHWSLQAGAAQRHPEAVEVWRGWNEARRRASPLLQPILDDDRAAGPRLRRLVAQLSSAVGAGEHPDDSSVQGPPLDLPKPEMREMLREAMNFAHRWTAITDQMAAVGAGSREDAAVLREDLIARAPGVQSELHQLAGRENSLAMQTAVGCLMLAVSQVVELLNPQAERPLQEPEPARVMNAELLKCIGLTLDGDWEPLAPWRQVEDEILTLLTEPAPDWRTTFFLQARAGNQAACEQLLSLPVWPRGEQDELNAWLNHAPGPPEEEIWRRLDDVESLVREAIDADFVPRDEQPELAARLAAVRHSLHQTDDAPRGRRELVRLQNELDARRKTELQRLREFLQRQRPEAAGASDSMVLRMWRKSRLRLVDARPAADSLAEQ